jgi:hypothetical protein
VRKLGATVSGVDLDSPEHPSCREALASRDATIAIFTEQVRSLLKERDAARADAKVVESCLRGAELRADKAEAELATLREGLLELLQPVTYFEPPEKDLYAVPEHEDRVDTKRTVKT